MKQKNILQEDEERMAEEKSELHKSGYYHGALSWRESVRLLEDRMPGVFLVRDSQVRAETENTKTFQIADFNAQKLSRQQFGKTL